mmetsp:Transcript_8288/g.17274  ORF Transcript_8288/g.17274 Transcript_8288/m.17274 type:complete len:84 (+) Transcript_8288:265-516(+)
MISFSVLWVPSQKLSFYCSFVDWQQEMPEECRILLLREGVAHVTHAPDETTRRRISRHHPFLSSGECRTRPQNKNDATLTIRA